MFFVKFNTHPLPPRLFQQWQQPILSAGGDVRRQRRFRHRDRGADADHHHHAHSVMGGAFDAIDPRHRKRHGDFFADRAFKRRCAGRDQAVDGGGVVAFVGGHKAHTVAGLDRHQRRVEHHRAAVAAVQQFDFHGFGLRGGTEQGHHSPHTQGGSQHRASSFSTEVAAAVTGGRHRTR